MLLSKNEPLQINNNNSVLKKILLLNIAIFILSCSNQPNYHQFGQDLCQCMQAMFELSEQIRHLTEEQDSTAQEVTIELLKELEHLSLNTASCVEQVQTEYPDIAPNHQKAEEAFEKNCPQIAKFLN